MPFLQQSRLLRHLPVLINALAFLYLLLRAFLVPLTYDEWDTYYLFARSPVSDIIGATVPIANNHVLNSLLVKASCALFGDGVPAMRLPNLLAACLYLRAAAGIGRLLFRDAAPRIGLQLTLLLNPALLEFLSLGRGYGMGMSLLLAGLYGLLSFFIKENKLYKFHLGALCLVLGCWASFVLLPFALCVFLAVAGYVWLRKAAPRSLAGWSLLYLLLSLSCLPPLLRIRSAGGLFYGGVRNFFSDSLVSMTEDLLGRRPGLPYQTLTAILILVYLTVAGLLFLRRSRVRAPVQQAALWLIPVPTLLLLILLNVQFYLLATPLPIYRSALYLYPLLVCCLAVLIAGQRLTEKTAPRILLPFAAALLVNFVFQANLDRTTEWWFDAPAPKVVGELKPAAGTDSLRLLVWPRVYKCLSYYRDRQAVPVHMDAAYEASDSLRRTYDFLYYPSDDSMSRDAGFSISGSFADGKLLLLRKR